MRVVTFIFALMLVMGLSFGGASYVGTQAAFADEAEGTADGKTEADAPPAESKMEEKKAEMKDEKAEKKGETPSGEMKDDAAK